MFDAVVIGLGSMIGAGVFAAIGPAAGQPVAACSSAWASPPSSPTATPYPRPASPAVYPASGGTYVYGRERLGAFWGYLAGWGFVVGKTASCAAMALTFGAYAAPVQRRWRSAAVVALTVVNYRGIRKTALAHPADRGRGPRCPRRCRGGAACSAARPARPTSAP